MSISFIESRIFSAVNTVTGSVYDPNELSIESGRSLQAKWPRIFAERDRSTIGGYTFPESFLFVRTPDSVVALHKGFLNSEGATIRAVVFWG